MKSIQRKKISDKQKARWKTMKHKCLCWKCKRTDCIQAITRDKLNNSKTYLRGGEVAGKPNLNSQRSSTLFKTPVSQKNPPHLNLKSTRRYK